MDERYKDSDPEATIVRVDRDGGGFEETVLMDKSGEVLAFKDWEARAHHGERVVFNAEGEEIRSDLIELA